MVSREKTELSIILLLLVTILVIIPAAGSREPYYPPDGTVSTYRWDFTGVRVIGTMDGLHIDANDSSSYNIIMTDNPTYAELDITYKTYGEFIEESIAIIMHNETHSLSAFPSFLLNKSTRMYVNEQGIITESGTTAGYIDPSDVMIGDQILISADLLNVTAKKNIKVAGTTREGWKLEGKFPTGSVIGQFPSRNTTCYYDTETGILLAVYLEELDLSIGGPCGTTPGDRFMSSSIGGKKVSQPAEEIVQYSRVLVSTNAWKGAVVSSTPFLEVIAMLVSLTAIRTVIRKGKSNINPQTGNTMNL
ncbi:MAG: hypothetical protein ACFFD4_12030 [Candidatus Odinarchaeota archaeon]